MVGMKKETCFLVKVKIKIASIMLISLIIVLSGCTNTLTSSVPSTSMLPTPTITPTLTPTPTPIPTPTSQPYTIEEKTAAKGILALKMKLKNPESLQVHEIRFYYNVTEPKDLSVLIDCSAQNGFGGMDRTIYCVMVSNKYSSLGWTDNSLGVTVFEDVAQDMLGDDLDVDRVMALVGNGKVE